jgi:ParB-like chromosome segregation protein Spo0J
MNGSANRSNRLTAVPQFRSGDAPEIRRVPVQSLLIGESPRLDGESLQHIQVLAESDSDLPPILVRRDSMQVVDGMHRLRAASIRGCETIEVQFFDGDDNEAFIAAVRANVTHGLPLTLADREAAAVRIIKAYPERSDRSIASVIGLAAKTVGAIRRRACSADEQVTARIGVDGRVRPVNGADGRRLASEVIAMRPDASLREVAKVAGISPTTVRDVRDRMRRGEDPIPAGQHRPDTPTTFRNDQDGDPETTAAESGATVRRALTVARGGTVARRGRDRVSLLHNLSRDPSLRFTDSGRNVLRMLFARACGPADLSEQMNGVQPHCAYVVAEVARACAEEWLEFAVELEQGLRSMA